MKRWTVLPVSVCLAAAFLFAPFTHFHEAGHAERHVAEEHAASLALHLHVSGREPSGPASSQWSSEVDESAHLLNWYRVKPGKIFKLTVAATVERTIPAAESSSLLPAWTPKARGHDPHLLSARFTRGPPA